VTVEMKPLLILGGGGHARVLIDALRQSKCDNIIGIIDVDRTKQDSLIDGVPVIGDESILTGYDARHIMLVNALGSIKTTEKRRLLFEKYKQKGYCFARVIHPAAIIAPGVILGEGTQVMAGAVIQPGCHIGDNSIINTRVSVDHGCRIGRSVHLAPGVTVSGEVIIDDNVHVGCGATVIQGIHIGQGSLVGAASLVIRHIPPDTTVIGVPAKVVCS